MFLKQTSESLGGAALEGRGSTCGVQAEDECREGSPSGWL